MKELCLCKVGRDPCEDSRELGQPAEPSHRWQLKAS